MAKIDRHYPNFEGNERLNLPDFLAVRDGYLRDLRFLVQAYIDGSGARLLKRYEEASHSGLTFRMKKDQERKFHDKVFEFTFQNPDRGTPTIDLDVAPGTTSIVGVRITYRKDDLQTRPFWDTDLNVNGEEFYDDIHIKVMVEEEFTVAAQLAEGWIPLFAVVADSERILHATDLQDLLWKPRPFSLLSAAHRAKQYDDLSDLRGYIDLIAALLEEMKGEGSAAKPWATLKQLREWQNLFVTGGGQISFGASPDDANVLRWSAPLRVEVAGRAEAYEIAPGGLPLDEGQVIYCAIPEGAPAGYLQLASCPVEEVPIAPTAEGTDPGILVLFLRRGDVVHGFMDIPELVSGETATIGVDLPAAIRSRLGIVSETSMKAYPHARVVVASDDYATAIGRLDAALWSVLTDFPREEVITITSPTTLVSATLLAWNPAVGNVDVKVFVNNLPQTQDQQGGDAQDFHKVSATALQFSYPLQPGWKVLIRDERKGGALAGDPGSGTGGNPGGGDPGGGDPDPTPVSVNFEVEFRVLTAAEAAVKQLSLRATPLDASKVAVDIGSGPAAQWPGVDFQVVGGLLMWAGLGLDGALKTGERMRIMYATQAQ